MLSAQAPFSKCKITKQETSTNTPLRNAEWPQGIPFPWTFSILFKGKVVTEKKVCLNDVFLHPYDLNIVLQPVLKNKKCMKVFTYSQNS